MTLTAQDIIPLQLKISRCGYVTLTPKWNKNDGCIKASRLYIVEQGSGYLRTATETIPLEPGYAYLIPANFKHAYGCTMLKKLYFQFVLVSKDNTDILTNINQVCRIRYDDKDLQTLLQHYESTDCLSVMTVRQTVLQMLCAILQQNNIPPISLSRKSPLVEKAFSYIHANLRITLTIGEISNHLFVSESKLRSAFLAETGITVGQYIDKQVHDRAKKLLSGTQLSIGEISTQLGFCDQFYLSRKFKAIEGITPTAYRGKLRNHP